MIPKTSKGGVDILITPDFDRPLFSSDAIILFENFDTDIREKSFLWSRG